MGKNHITRVGRGAQRKTGLDAKPERVHVITRAMSQTSQVKPSQAKSSQRSQVKPNKPSQAKQVKSAGMHLRGACSDRVQSRLTG